MYYKSSIITTIAAFCLIIFVYAIYDKFSVTTVEYTGLGESEPEAVIVKPDIIITDQILNSDKIEFVQRKITGGGVNPGWVISLLETQPNIFTGRVIVDDGVYQHPVTLKEEVENIFVGEMKGKDGKKEAFSMKRVNKECTDTESNIFEYSLSGAYGATQFSGCGGDVIKEAE